MISNNNIEGGKQKRIKKKEKKHRLTNNSRNMNKDQEDLIYIYHFFKKLKSSPITSSYNKRNKRIKGKQKEKR
jgi:hypothetical protein